MRSRWSSAALSAGLVSLAMVLAACGGGGGGGTITLPPPNASVTVSPLTVSVTIPTTQTFTATVVNSNNTTVNWSVQEGAAGGTITSQGVYMPPSNHTGTYHIVATLQSDATKSATATATVLAPAPVISSTPPSAATENSAYTYTPSATDPANSGVTFSLVTAPSGATLSGNTISWTPDNTQSRQPNDFALKATTGLGVSTTQHWTVTPTGNVVVTGTLYVVLDSGTTQTQLTPGVSTGYVPNSNGGFDTVQSDSQGVFLNLPPGYFWLNASPGFYVWTKANHYHIDEYYPGRPGIVFPGSQTLITYNLGGLTPTTTSDNVEFFSLAQPAMWSLRLTSYPAGSTSISYVHPSYDPLLDASQGDKCYISQLSSVAAGSGQFNVITASTGAIGITENGSNQTFDLTLTPAGLNSSFRGNVKASAFASLAPKMGANATDGGSNTLGAYALPPPWLNGATLAKYTGAQFSTDQDFGDVSFGDPFPNNWVRIIQYIHNSNMPIQINGKNFTLHPQLWYQSTTLPSASAPIQPLVGPVENPKINNASFTADQSGVGLHPTLSWTPSATGKADYYTVDLVQLTVQGSLVGYSYVDTYVTTTTSITLPVGLQTGTTYRFIISSINMPLSDAESGQMTLVTSYGAAEVYSGAITP